MKHPSPEKIRLAIADIRETLPKFHSPRLDMSQPSVVHDCGTTACFAGWYLLSQYCHEVFRKEGRIRYYVHNAS